jgi:hypothetical protein
MGIIMVGTAQRTEFWDPGRHVDASVRVESDGRIADDDVSLRLGLGLLLLLESSAYARMLDEDPWEFSVEWPELQRVGVNGSEGRWLIHRGLVGHAYEVTSLEDRRRRFVASQNLGLSRRSCLVLTEAGHALARRVAEWSDADLIPVADSRVAMRLGYIGRPDGAAMLRQPPTWDSDRRQLRVGSRIVKEFKVPAMNQEIVLTVFEEERWPTRIDDPLPWKSDIDPQRRLHDTINSLNRRQRHRLIHFSADGLAQGIRWELIENAPAEL